MSGIEFEVEIHNSCKNLISSSTISKHYSHLRVRTCKPSRNRLSPLSETSRRRLTLGCSGDTTAGPCLASCFGDRFIRRMSCNSEIDLGHAHTVTVHTRFGFTNVFVLIAPVFGKLYITAARAASSFRQVLTYNVKFHQERRFAPKQAIKRRFERQDREGL